MTDTPPTDLVKDRPSPGAVLAEQLTESARKRDKSKDLKPLMRLWPYMRRQWGDGLMALLFMLISTSATLALTATVKTLVDHLTAADAAAADQAFVLVGLVTLVLGMATALRYFFVTKVGERVVADLRIDTYAHVLKLDPAFFIRTRTGEVLSRLTTDVQLLETLTTTSISLALRNALSLVGGLALLLVVSPGLTGLVLLIFPVVLLPLFIFGRQVGKLTTKTQDKFAEAVGAAGENLDALETVQAFGREALASQRFAEAVNLAFKTSVVRMTARAMMTAMVITLIFGGIVAVLWLGAQGVRSGDMSVGALVQFVFLSVLVAGSFGNLGETWGDVQKAAGAMQRIGELLSSKPNIAPPAHPVALPVPARGAIRFEGVNFAYPGRPDMTALHDFSLEIHPGETVALVGPSGAGKSTVFRLLLRFYDPVAGRVLIDGVDLKDADPVDVRARLSLVAQDTALFSGSAADNIRFAAEGASDADIRKAAERAQALGFIEALPEGFDTPIGERGKSLSGGQKQRLSIARALARPAPVLLLDEATSALDAENERLVQQALDEAMSGRTTLVIAHRLATVLRADRIVVMDQGRVVETGTHAALVAKGGLYARLAELQFDTGTEA